VISVSIVPPNGDIAFKCSLCDKIEIVTARLSWSPFADEYAGHAVLLMLGHYGSAHGTKPRNTQQPTATPADSQGEKVLPEPGT
jgi:hypothetical protein